MTDEPTPAEALDAHLAATARPETPVERADRQAAREVMREAEDGPALSWPAVLFALAGCVVVLAIILGAPHLPGWVGR